MRISFLIPAYNERGTILEVLDRIEALGLDRQLIVIDDGSTDGTSDLLREWQQGREGGSSSPLRSGCCCSEPTSTSVTAWPSSS